MVINLKVLDVFYFFLEKGDSCRLLLIIFGCFGGVFIILLLLIVRGYMDEWFKFFDVVFEVIGFSISGVFFDFVIVKGLKKNEVLVK